METTSVPNPTPTATVYALDYQVPVKIGTIGSSVNGQFISSSALDAPYTFGSQGNRFYISGDSPNMVRDATLVIAILSFDAQEQVIPPTNLRTEDMIWCGLNPGIEQQRICPLSCYAFWPFNNKHVFGTWNCGGKWSSINAGSCTQFQAYVVS